MSTIAQRRVAGATALMILLYLLQMALLAPPAEATNSTTGYGAPNPEYVAGAPDWSGVDPYAPLSRTGSTPVHHDGGPGNHEADLYLAYDCATSTMFVQVLTQDGVTLDQTGDHFLKIAQFPGSGKAVDDGTGDFAYIFSGEDAIGWTASFSINEGSWDIDLHTQVLNGGSQTASTNTGSTTIPLVIECSSEETPVTVSVTGECITGQDGSANGFIDVFVSIAEGATVNVAGQQYDETTDNIPATPGTYPWTASAATGFDLQGESSGSVTIENCSETQDEPVTVSVVGECVTGQDGAANGRIDITISVTDGATVTVGGQSYTTTTLNIPKAPGTYPWSAVAGEGYFVQGAVAGSVTVADCSDRTTTTRQETTTTEPPTTSTSDTVLGTTIVAETTVPEVSAETLPFTGSASGDVARLGLLAALAGALMLFAVRGPKEEEEAAAEIGGWSSL